MQELYLRLLDNDLLTLCNHVSMKTHRYLQVIHALMLNLEEIKTIQSKDTIFH